MSVSRVRSPCQQVKPDAPAPPQGGQVRSVTAGSNITRRRLVRQVRKTSRLLGLVKQLCEFASLSWPVCNVLHRNEQHVDRTLSRKLS